MRCRNVLWLGACCLLVGTSLLAQSLLAQGFRGPGPGGPRGPGFGDPLGSLALLAIPEVQQELQLSDEQKPKVADVLSKMQEQARTVFESFNPQELFGLEEKERDQRFAKMRSRMDAITKKIGRAHV